jgi:hypothetical protein
MFLILRAYIRSELLERVQEQSIGFVEGWILGEFGFRYVHLVPELDVLSHQRNTVAHPSNYTRRIDIAAYSPGGPQTRIANMIEDCHHPLFIFANTNSSSNSAWNWPHR